MADTSGTSQASGPEYQLSDNIAVDLVKYVRSNTIRNEQQFLLLSLAYGSGLFADTNDYVSSVTIGTSSSGKTHLKDKVDDIYGLLDVMDASTGTEKALIHDDDWDECDVVSMGELQQPPEEMIEFMKRAHGGDEEVVIRQTRGNPQSGFETDKIVKKSKSYHFTFAQFEADFEFWNRLLKIPVHESESKNKAVGRMVAGHSNIQIEGEDVEYGYPFPDGTAAIREHMLRVKQHAPKRAVLPTNDEGEEWGVWSIMKPVFNHSRTEVNRIYSMVFNLVKTSAMLNYQHRERQQVEVTGSDGEVSMEEAVVVAPQDVANLVRCLQALRATTHEIDRKKRAIVEGIREKSGPDNAIEGTGPIREFLKESDAPEVKASELEVILEDLEDNFLVEINEDAGEGGKNVYRAFEWDQLGRPNIDEHASLFESCTDPLTGDPFLDAWSDQRSAIEATAAELLGSAERADQSGTASVSSGGLSSGSVSTTEDGDASLGTWDESEDDDLYTVEPWVADIHERIYPVLDGNRIEDMNDVPVEAFLGLVSLSDPDLTGVSPSGTMLDGSHDVWDRPGKADSWVSSKSDARKQIKFAVGTLIDEEIISFAEVHDTDKTGSPVDVTLSLVSPDDVTAE